MPRLEWRIEMLTSAGGEIVAGVSNEIVNPRAARLWVVPSKGESSLDPSTTHELLACVLQSIADDLAVRIYWGEDRRRIRSALRGRGVNVVEHPHGVSCSVSAAQVALVLDATAGLGGGRAVGFVGEPGKSSVAPISPRDGWRRLSCVLVLELFDDSVLIEPLCATADEVLSIIAERARALGIDCKPVG